jgi:hypothetical protein
LLAPDVPIRVTAPLVPVLKEPPVIAIPCGDPVVPSALAVMWMKPVELMKSALVAKPMPPSPWPTIPVTAVMLPFAVKDAPFVIPLPPAAPPAQLMKVTVLAPMKVAPIETPSPPPAPPVQPVKRTSALVPVAQELVLENP